MTRDANQVRQMLTNDAIRLQAVQPASGQHTFSITDCFPTKPKTPARTWSQPSVGLFEAVERGLIEAKVVVRDANHARLMLTNKTAAVQAIQLPEVMAARPVLAQFGPGGGQGMVQNGVGQTGSIMAPQTVGATAGPGGQSSSMGPGGGFPSFFNNNNLNNVFNIAPEQVRRIDLDCLCLEQGKPNPRSVVPYELVPLAEVNDDPRLVEVIRAYGAEAADREVAQAAAWHLANEMTWDELAKLSQRVALNADRPVFNTQQLRQARLLVERAAAVPTKSPEAATTQAVKPPRL